MPLALDQLTPHARVLVESLQSATSNDEGDNRTLLASWPEDLFLGPKEIQQLPLTPVQRGLIALQQLQASDPSEVTSRRAVGQALADIFLELAAQKPEWLFPPTEKWLEFPDHAFARAKPSAATFGGSGYAYAEIAEIYFHQAPFATLTQCGLNLSYGGFGSELERNTFAQSVGASQPARLPRTMDFVDIPPNLRSYIRGALQQGTVPFPKALTGYASEDLAALQASNDFMRWALGELDRTCPARNAQLRLERARAVLESTQRVVRAEMLELSSLAQLVRQMSPT